MLPHHLDLRCDADGLTSVEVTFDLSAPQVAGALHAVRVMRDARHRVQALSADDVLAMRELTSLADELALLEIHSAAVTMRANPARLGALRGALDEFASADHIEREGDAEHRPVIFALADAIADLHVQALRAVLNGAPAPL